jgi:hypothetical protein
MRQWTPEERAQQALLIRRWQPWKKAGVKTPEGKAISCMNARKHGCYGTEIKTMREEIRLSRKILNEWEKVSKS